MIFATIGHSFVYETEKLARAFFPFEKFRFSDALPPDEDGISTAVDAATVTARLQLAGRAWQETGSCLPAADEKGRELAMATVLYRLLCRFAGYTPCEIVFAFAAGKWARGSRALFSGRFAGGSAQNFAVCRLR